MFYEEISIPKDYRAMEKERRSLLVLVSQQTDEIDWQSLVGLH